MHDMQRASVKVRFIPLAPDLRQPALMVRLALKEGTRASAAELSAQLAQLISVHLPEPAPWAFESDADGSACGQLLRVVSDCYVWILRGCGLPVFGRALIQDAEPASARALLPCPEGQHQAATAVLQWLLTTANLAFENESLEPRKPALALLVAKVRTQAPPGLNTIRFLDAAFQQGIPIQRITGTTYQYGWGARARWFDSSFTDVTPTIASNLARDKFATSRLLAHAGLPVPTHQFASSETQALRIAAELGYPVVVKPSDKDGGLGVSAGLRNEAQVVTAYHAARKVSSRILVEKHFEGNDYRLQVLNGKVFWAVHRIPGGVVGDGSATIRELLALVNQQPGRGERGSNALLKRIDLDDEAQDLLVQQGLTPDSVPEADRFVRLRRAANVASGGHPVPVLEVAHPDNLELAARAARLLRLDLAGVDLLIPDIRQSWVATGAAICEVNAQPQLSPHLPGQILQRLVKGQGRIPVVLILGILPALQFSLGLAKSLSLAGVRVGFASRPRSFVGLPSHVIGTGQTQMAARALLLDPRVEAAVISLDSTDLTKENHVLDQCSAIVLLGDPPSGPESEAVLKCIHQWVALCTGKVYCEKDPSAWGLAQDSRLHKSEPQTTLEDISVTVRQFWEPELRARRRPAAKG